MGIVIGTRRHREIGQNIRRLRLARKMRQIDLAERAGLSWRHLIRMERGEGGEPKPETLARIADALGVERSELDQADEDDEEAASMPLTREEQDVLVALFSRLAQQTGIRA